MYCILSNKKGLVLCLRFVCVCVCEMYKIMQFTPPVLLSTSIHKLQTPSFRHYWVRLPYNRNIYSQTHISKGSQNYRCTSGTSCLFKNNIWQFLQKPCMVPVKVKIPDSCSTILAVSNEMILRNYGNLKFDYACQILLTIPAEMKQKAYSNYITAEMNMTNYDNS